MPMPRGPISSSAPPSFRIRKKKPGEVNPTPNNEGRLTGPPMQQGAGQGSMFADGRKGQAQGNPPRTPNYPAGGPGPRRGFGHPEGSVDPTPSYPLGGPGPRGVQGQPQGGHPRNDPKDVSYMANGRMGRMDGQPQGMAPRMDPRDVNYGARPHMADGRKPRRMMADGDQAPDDDMIGNPTPVGGQPDDQADGPQMDDTQAPPQQGAGGGQMPVIRPEAVNYHDEDWDCRGCKNFGPDGSCAVLQMQVSPEGGCNAWEQGQGGDQDQDSGIDTGAGFTQNPEGTSGAPSLS